MLIHFILFFFFLSFLRSSPQLAATTTAPTTASPTGRNRSSVQLPRAPSSSGGCKYPLTNRTPKEEKKKTHHSCPVCSAPIQFGSINHTPAPSSPSRSSVPDAPVTPQAEPVSCVNSFDYFAFGFSDLVVLLFRLLLLLLLPPLSLPLHLLLHPNVATRYNRTIHSRQLKICKYHPLTNNHNSLINSVMLIIKAAITTIHLTNTLA